MFPNVRAEMARRKLTVQGLSERTGIPYSTLAPKLRGDKPIKLDEAERIKAAINTEMPIEVLFSTSEG